MLTPSKFKKDFSNAVYDFTLLPGETKEQQNSNGMYAVRATRSISGNRVTIYKRFATNKFYTNNIITYQQYLQQLNKPMNHGSLIEAF